MSVPPTTYTYIRDDTRAFRTPHAWRDEFSDTPGEALERRPLLDRRSDPHPLLDALLNEALQRMLFTADGSTTSLAAKVSGSHDGASRAPVSSLAEELERFAKDYAGSRTHRARLRVIKDAQDAGTRLLFAPDRSRVAGTQEWRDAIAADPRSCRDLEVIYGVGKSTIARIKKAGVGRKGVGRIVLRG